MEKTSADWQEDSSRKQRSRTSKKESNQSGRKVSANRPAKEHTFLTDVANVRTMEHGLLTLLNDFHSGKLQAFGSNATFNKMDAIRIQQEQLAKQHFELDLLPRSASSRMNAEESRKENSEKMDKLIDQLHDLSYSVQALQTNFEKKKGQS